MPHRRSSLRRFLLLSAVLLGAAQPPGAAGADAPVGLPALASRAGAGDLDAARELRAAGPAGLSALVDAAVPASGRFTELPFRQALDLVCAQVDCFASRLYWYTDLAAARREAERTGRPILSLRLLGRLDEELSCANSRYFRLMLYSDPAVAAVLRERVVLHWSSERPVPKVTVDYGDGRRLVGTVTGNSVHYLLDPHGRLVDALPGLHAPHRFRAWVEQGADRAAAWASLGDDELLERLRAEHDRADRALVDELQAGLVELGWGEQMAEAVWRATLADEAVAEPAPSDEAPIPMPTAGDAARLALTKSRGESPVLTAIGMEPTVPEPSLAIDQLALSDPWRAELSPESEELVIARAAPDAKADLEGALIRLRNSVSEDGLRNEAFLHRRIHQRLAAAEALPDWRAFNAWVYAELFLTPAGDPWLGLAPSDLLATLRPAR
jgi:hypothetical protein